MPNAFYLVPYKRKISLRDLPYSRYCAMNDYNQEIVAVGGGWSETDIGNDNTIVRVRATDAVLDSIGLVFPRLSETEAKAACPLTRGTPRYDADTDKLMFDISRPSPVISIDDLVRRVPNKAMSIELKSIIGLWLGIGFGFGWRIPYWLAVYGALTFGEPTALWRSALKVAFDQAGTFPTTSILDNFNRANENPLGNGNWARLFGSGSECQILSNQGASAGAGVVSTGYWTTSFGPNSEVFVTLATIPDDDIELYLRVLSPGTTSLTGYKVTTYHNPTYNQYEYTRRDSSSSTLLGSIVTGPTLVSGNKLGLEMLGSTLIAYTQQGAGAWAAIDAGRSDATYGAAGVLGMRMDDATIRFDDFSGGAILGTSMVFRRGMNPALLSM